LKDWSSHAAKILIRERRSMLSDGLRHPTPRPGLLAPVDGRIAPLFCLLLLTAACALASLAFACATPFAAFAALAAATLPLSSALSVVFAAWIVNQAIGFGVLGYPTTLNTFLWGGAIGAAALIATIASCLALPRLPAICRPIELALTLLAAYVAYEVILFAFTPVLGGAGAFTVAIVTRIGLLNTVWMIGLAAAYELLKVTVLRHLQFVT
jgi:hypothetical protein